MADPLRLYGMKGVVTGAASGIGEAIARTFAKHGAEVLAVDAPGSRIETAFRRVRGITAIGIDMNAPAMAAKLTQASLDELGGVDILVNNLMRHPESTSGPHDEASYRPELERRLQQMTDIIEAVLPLLKQSPAGRIINVSCLRSAFGPGGRDALLATRHAIARLTAAQAATFGGHGINANYIQPGAIMTPRSRLLFDADKAFRNQCIEQSAAKRLGEALDVAKVALFLASDDSVFVSGTGIEVDGGVVLSGDK